MFPKGFRHRLQHVHVHSCLPSSFNLTFHFRLLHVRRARLPPPAQVTAGTVIHEGPVTVRATGTGAHSTIAGIGRLVSDAQASEAPIQRLADSVSGVFCYTVMAASAATFAFWSLAGAQPPHSLCSKRD